MFYSIQSNVRNDNVAYDNFPVEYLYRISISVKCNIFVICEFKARLYTELSRPRRIEYSKPSETYRI